METPSSVFYINSFVFTRVLPAESLLLKIYVYQRGLLLQRNLKKLFVDTNIRLVLELFKLVFCECIVVSMQIVEESISYMTTQKILENAHVEYLKSMRSELEIFKLKPD